MYKIEYDSKTYLTETPNFIRRIYPGGYILTDKEHSNGIAYNGTPMLYENGAVVSEIDIGTFLLEAKQKNIDLENALCDQDTSVYNETSMLEDALCYQDNDTAQRLSMVEDALCEIDSTKETK